MKRLLALLLAAMLLVTLLPGCGQKQSGDDSVPPGDSTQQGADGVLPDEPEPEPYVDPYEAVKTYWSDDQLTQEWGPEQIVEHLAVSITD